MEESRAITAAADDSGNTCMACTLQADFAGRVSMLEIPAGFV